MTAKSSAPLSWEDVVKASYHEVGYADVTVDETTMNLLLDRTAKQWNRISAVDPYWSVLTDEANRGETLSPEREKTFFDTGASAMTLLDIFEQRNGVQLKRGVCMELGCGVGRLTANLADSFEKVIAVDVSTFNLEIAKRKMEDEGIDNVEFRLISQMSDLEKLPAFDVFYSFIVLQHNSPPVQKKILGVLLPKVRSGFLFQTATNIVGQHFRAQQYLDYPDTGMEIHNLPQHVINETVRASGLNLHETSSDTWVGTYGSTTFFGSSSN